MVAVPILFILAVPGFPKTENAPALRVIMEILLVAGLMVYLMVLMNGLVRPGKDRVVIDERDRAILERAPAVQARAMMVSIAAWTIILTEAYWETGQVPVVFMALVFWSCLVVAMMALPIGVLFGYWRN